MKKKTIWMHLLPIYFLLLICQLGESQDLTISIVPYNNILCPFECENVEVIVTGGTAPYIYSATAPLQPSGANIFSFCQDVPGSYQFTITVVDDAGNLAEIVGDFIVDICCEPLFLELEGPLQLCVNECGQYNAVINGGNGSNFDYFWYYGAVFIGEGETIELCPENAGGGQLNLTALGINGCDEFYSYDIEVINNFPLEIVSTSPAACPDNDGNSICDKTCANSTITYTVPGSQAMDLSWEVVGAESYEIDNNLVSVTWGNPGVGEITVTSGVPDAGFILGCTPLSSADSLVAGTNAGSAQVFVQGDPTQYTYTWCNGYTSQIAFGLAAGLCGVTVTDNNGNISTCEVDIPSAAQGCENSDLAITNVTIIEETCGQGGSIDISLYGNNGPFDFEWSNGSIAPDISGLDGGNYCVTVFDASGCTISSCFLIQEPAELNLNTYVSYSISSVGANDGEVTGQIFGGTPPYTWWWTADNGGTVGGQTGTTIFSLAEGTYCLTAIDINGCEIVECIDLLSDPTSNCYLTAYITITEPPTGCFTQDGIIQAGGSGLAPPYTYEWDTGDTISTQSGLVSGTYCLTITDAVDCTATDCVDLFCDGPDTENFCIGSGSLCIDIIEEPNAIINSIPAATNGTVELCRGETIFLQNESTAAENYVWELGDGYSTSAEELEHSYAVSGQYDILLIARNECFCIDTTRLRVLVSDAEIPEIICTGTTCTNTEQTYNTTADCSNFNWLISSNGTITDGGGATDNFVSVNWGSGPMGEVSLDVANCNSAYCDNATIAQIPIIIDGTPIEGPAKICPGEVSTYSLPLWTGTAYGWTVANGGEIKSGQFTNTISVKWNVELDINNPLWVNATYDNCFLDCGGESTKDVAITPEFYLAGPIEVCENSSSAYMAFDALQNNPVLCNWSVVDPTGITIWTAAAATAVDVDWPLVPGKYNLTAEPVDLLAFCNNEYAIYVNVQAGPTALSAIDGQNAICPGEYYSYSAVANQGSVSYRWEINNGGSITEDAGDVINIQWGNSPPYTLTVWQTSTNGLACESLPFTMAVDAVTNINMNGPTAICVEEVSTYTANAIGNATYDWVVNPSNAGTLLSGQGTEVVEILWHSVGTATISLSLCGASENLSVDVAGFPNPMVTHPTELCPGTMGMVSSTTPFSSYSWRNEIGNVVSTSSSPNLSPGFYELIVTNATGCSGQISFEIDELPGPDISISNPVFDFYCEPAGFPIPTLYALNTDEGYTYEWYRNGVALNVFTEVFTPTLGGNYYVEVTDVNGCTANSNTITLVESCGTGGGGPPVPGDGACPNVSNVFNVGAECNHGLFENTSTGYVPGTVQWFFDDPASGANNTSNEEMPEHYFSGAGFYNIVMTVASPGGAVCFIYEPFEVALQANFDALFTCPGFTTEFEDISTFTPGTTIVAWNWNFGDPTSGANNTSSLEQPGHIYNSVGTYEITMTVTAQSGCTSTITKNIEVLPPPTADFAAPQNSCAATALEFNANLPTGITSMSWDFGDPASGDANTAVSNNTFHAFSSSGIYTVELYFENIYGCSNNFSLPVNVDANSLAGEITMNPSSPICEGNSTEATASPGATSWLWSTDQVLENITLVEAGVYEVTVTDGFGCTYSPPPAILDVVPGPDGTIKVTEYNEFGQPADCFFDGYILCEGEDVYLSISGAGDYSYSWSGGETGNEVVYDDEHNNNLGAGSYDFTVTITDNVSGCTSIEGPYTIVVNPVPTGIVIGSIPAGPICEGTEATFLVNNPDVNLTYLWSTGEYGGSITASTAGEYFVKGISAFGCEGESNTLEIHRSPDARLVPDGCHTHCAPDTICLPEMPEVVNYQWYLDGNLIPAPDGTVADYLPEVSGSYHLSLFDVNGCYAISDPFDLTLLPFDIDSLLLGACSGTTVLYAGEDLMPGSVTDFHFTNQWGCDSMITVTVGVDIGYEFSETIYTCAETPVLYNGIMYDAGDQIDLAYTTSFGCDSIIHLDVIGFPIYSESETFARCTGTSVLYAGIELFPGADTLFSMETFRGCDSIVNVVVLENLAYSETVDLNGCAGESVMYEGVSYPVGTTEVFNYLTLSDCDSIITLNVMANPIYNETENFISCEGSEVEFAGVMLSPGTDTLFQFLSQYGCDSTIQVMVEGVAVFEDSIALVTCGDELVMYEGLAYPPGTNEEFNFLSTEGCDSTIYLTVTGLPEYNLSEVYTACTGTFFLYNGIALSPGTDTLFSMQTLSGCDSIVNVIIVENLAYSETVELNACSGETAMYEGIAYLAGTTVVFNYNTIENCDSVITLNVLTNPVYADSESFTTCNNSQINYAGIMLNPGTDTLFQFVSQYGCDSTVQVTVTGVPIYEEQLGLYACEGTGVIYNGNFYAIGTDIDLTYQSVQGCDSIIYLTVSALLSYETSETYSTCAGTTIAYAGENLSPGTVALFEMTTWDNCDSLVTVTVLEDPVYTEIVNLSACDGMTATYQGIDYMAGTTTTLEYATIAGCDSNTVVTVVGLPLSDSVVLLTTCPGTTVEYNNDDLAAGTITTYLFTNQNGCDSIVDVTVTALPVTTETVNIAACEGSTVPFGGIDYPPGTQTFVLYENQYGCDSIIDLNVATLPVSMANLTLAVCPGETTTFDGVELEGGDVSEFIFTSVDGCDSIIVVDVEILPDFDFALNTSGTICWNSDVGEVQVEAVVGGPGPYSYGINNTDFQSDSMFTALSPGIYTVYVQDENGCVNDQAVLISEIPPLELEFIAPALDCTDDSILVQTQVLNGITDSMTYFWEHNVTGTFTAVYDPGVYTIAVSNACETRSFDYEVDLDNKVGDGYFYIPNAFSPNNDGVNDIFRAYTAEGIEVLTYELHLFDRWGNNLYTTEELVEGWDGVFLEEAMNPGVYVWWLKAEVLVCGRRMVDVFEKGDVTILK